MAQNDFLAFPTQVMNPQEWEARLVCINKSNFNNTQISRQHTQLISNLLALADKNSEFADVKGDPDAIFSKLFNGAGIKINPSLTDDGIKPSSRGDMLNFKATFESGHFISELNMESTYLVDMEIDFLTQSFLAGILAVGKAYFCSLKWYIRATRVPFSAGLGLDDPYYVEARPQEEYDSTEVSWNKLKDQNKINDVRTVFCGGNLVNVDIYPGASRTARTGTIKITGIYSVSNSPTAFA